MFVKYAIGQLIIYLNDILLISYCQGGVVIGIVCVSVCSALQYIVFSFGLHSISYHGNFLLMCSSN